MSTTCRPLHTTGGPCEVLQFTSDGEKIITMSSKGHLAAASVADEAAAPERGVEVVEGNYTAAAVSSGREWLATGKETDSCFGVWVCPLSSGDALQPSTAPTLVARFTLAIRHLSWHPSKPLLGIGTDDGKLSVYAPNEEQKSRRREFKLQPSDGGVRCLAFDPRGEVLAAAVSSGALIIFKMEDAVEIHRVAVWPKATLGEEQLQIAWQPDGEALALAGSPTVRVVLRGAYSPVAEFTGGHRCSTTAVAWSSCGTILASASRDAVAIWGNRRLLKTFHLDAEPHGLMWKGAEGVAVGTAVGSFVYLPAPSVSEDAGEAAAAVDGEETAQAAPASAEGEGEDKAEDGADSATQAPQREAPKAVVQAAFQPGATSSRSGRRYLAWSEHGALKFHPAPTGSNTTGVLEVEYSQRAAAGRGGRELQAPERTTLGAVGPGVCAVATAAALVVTWMNEKRFEHQMPPGEEIVSLAIGAHFVAALTSPGGLLNIASIAGVPIAVLTLSGTPVCLAAREDMLFVVTAAPGATAEPSLEYALYAVAARERLAAGRIPLSEGASLRWAGLSSDGCPLALDSCGQLRALALAGVAPGAWVPVARLESGGARLWPVRAEGGALYCVAVAKDGGEPPVGPMRRLQEVRYRIPLEAKESELLLRHGLISSHLGFALGAGLLPTPARTAAREDYEKKSNGRQALGLFALLAKSGEVEQALDVAESYFQPMPERPHQAVRLLEEAKALAEKMGREALASKVGDLLAEAQPEDGAGEQAAAEEEAAAAAEQVEAERKATARIAAERAENERRMKEETEAEDARLAEEAKAARITEETAETARLQAKGAPNTGGITAEQAALIRERREEALRRAAAKRAATAAGEGCPAAARQRVE